MTCRLCGLDVPKRQRQMYDNNRQHIKHECSHGRECESGKRGIISQTLEPRCKECRIERVRQQGR